MKKIPYGKQSINQEDIQAVVDVLNSEFLTQGPTVLEFEKNFAKYVGAKYAVAVSNATAALHLSAMVMNVKPGDKVITTSLTFVASANCIRYCGGELVFADIDRKTYLIDINEVRQILKHDKKNEIKGIIVVDFAGSVVDLQAFRELADEFGCWLIEDACHSPGGSFQNKDGKVFRSGSGSYANLSIFSFHPVKHIAAGEGGMITTNDINYYKRLKSLRTHGIQQDKDMNVYDNSLWYYEMQELGYNYRLTDIQASLGNSQLKRADEGISKRRIIAEKYKEAFNNHPQIIDRNEGMSKHHAYHLYIIEVTNRKELHSFLRENNIFAQIHYIPVHLMPYYRQKGWKKGDMPNVEAYYLKCISLPIYPTLSIEDQNMVIKKINAFYS